MIFHWKGESMMKRRRVGAVHGAEASGNAEDDGHVVLHADHPEKLRQVLKDTGHDHQADKIHKVRDQHYQVGFHAGESAAQKADQDHKSAGRGGFPVGHVSKRSDGSYEKQHDGSWLKLRSHKAGQRAPVVQPAEVVKQADQHTATLGVEEDVTKLQAEVEALKAEIAAMKGDGDPPAKEPAAEPAAEGDMAAKAAQEKLSRVAEISALAKLAKVDDATKQLMLDAGFSRAEAQDWLKSCGHLSTINPPVSESDDAAAKKESPEEVFGREWDAHQDVFARQGVSRELYVKSRIKDAK
jgi:hypothetical protein